MRLFFISLVVLFFQSTVFGQKTRDVCKQVEIDVNLLLLDGYDRVMVYYNDSYFMNPDSLKPVSYIGMYQLYLLYCKDTCNYLKVYRYYRENKHSSATYRGCILNGFDYTWFWQFYDTCRVDYYNCKSDYIISDGYDSGVELYLKDSVKKIYYNAIMHEYCMDSPHMQMIHRLSEEIKINIYVNNKDNAKKVMGKRLYRKTMKAYKNGTLWH